MPKLVLDDVSNLLGNPTSAQNTVNENSRKIETALEKTLSRDGSTPNQMEADLDMNHNDLLNIGDLSVDSITIDGTEVNGSNVVVKTDLADVAFSGSYNDLVNLPVIPAAQVNSDWNASSGVAEILNKPTLGTAAAANVTDFATAAQGATADSAVQPSDLATVAISGSYNDLSDKPTIPPGTVTSVGLTVPTGLSVSGSPVTSSGTFAVTYTAGYQGYTSSEASKLSGIEASADVTDTANVTAAGAIMDSDFPANGLMTRTAAGTYITRAVGAGTGITLTNGTGVAGNPTVALSAASISSLSLADSAVQPGDLATVATTGSYNDLSNKPTIPAAQVNSDWNASSGVAQILNKPTLGTLAAKNQVSVPSDINASGVASSSTFLRGDGSWAAAGGGGGGDLLAANNLSDLVSPTTALTNLGLSADGKSLVTAATYTSMKTLLGLATVATTGSYNDLSNKPTIPAGTVTSVQVAVPTGLSVSGGPITTSGTITLAWASGYRGYQGNASDLSSGTVPDARLPSRLNIAASTISGADCNNATANGWYYIGTTNVNGPAPGSPCIMRVEAFTASYLMQTAWVRDQVLASNTNTYIRQCVNGVWGAWFRLRLSETEQQALWDARYVGLAGGTMTGALTLSGAPVSDLHAATKKYVDDKTAGVSTRDLRITHARFAEQSGTLLGYAAGVSDYFDDATGKDASSANVLYDATDKFFYGGAGGTVDGTTNILPTMTSGTTGGYTFTSDSNFSGVSAYYAGDKNTATAWSSTVSAYPHWLQVQGPSKKLSGYSITPRQDSTTYQAAPGTFKFQGSNDGSSWTDLDTQTGVVFASAADKKTFTIPSGNRGSYTYHRIYATAGSANNTYCAISEIEFFEETTFAANEMDFRTVAATATVAPTRAFLGVTAKSAAAFTVNTDIIGSISRDGGASWTDVSFSTVTTLADGTVILEAQQTNISAQPSGTSVMARIATKNGKAIQLCSIVYHWGT